MPAPQQENPLRGLPPDPFARPFLTAANGELLVHRRRPDGAVETLWRDRLVDGSESTTLTDGKFVPSRSEIAALVGSFAGVVSYPAKKVMHRFDQAGGEHAVEFIPRGAGRHGGPHLVLACSEGDYLGLRVFDLSKKDGLRPVQQLRLPSSHALHWDEPTRSLWALGTNVFPRVRHDPPLKAVHGELRRYPVGDSGAGPLGEPTVYRLRDSPKVPGYKDDWRDGPHDLLLLPDTRTFLISTDLDVFQFDIHTADPNRTPEENFTPARHGVLKGFTPRRPKDGLGSIKAMSLSPDGKDLLIAQADDDFYSTHLVSYRLDTQVRSDLQLPYKTYKARWFTAPDVESY
ncbi:hypothetical protein ABZW10_18910 [Kitasatospora sp. NPDC004723]|uniref:hypothetical protein n=1 Tax=Kitasatospora sp. NPDC004723 TaxID=3154288 RepID=UPI0033A53DAF